MELIKPEFQHKDLRRTLTQLLTADLKQINVYECKKGTILGDHFHKETIEVFYVIKGRIKYNERPAAILPGQAFIVPPLENHKLRCITRVKLMSFLSKPFVQEDSDTYKLEPPVEEPVKTEEVPQ